MTIRCTRKVYGEPASCEASQVISVNFPDKPDRPKENEVKIKQVWQMNGRLLMEKRCMKRKVNIIKKCEGQRIFIAKCIPIPILIPMSFSYHFPSFIHTSIGQHSLLFSIFNESTTANDEECAGQR